MLTALAITIDMLEYALEDRTDKVSMAATDCNGLGFVATMELGAALLAHFCKLW